MNKRKDYSELGQLIDCTEDDFKDYCSSKDVGYLSGLLNLMTQTYNHVTKVNDDLVAKGANMPKPLSKDMQNTLKGLHSKLMSIELRVFLLRDFVDSKQLEPVEKLALKDN